MRSSQTNLVKENKTKKESQNYLATATEANHKWHYPLTTTLNKIAANSLLLQADDKVNKIPSSTQTS